MQSGVHAPFKQPGSLKRKSTEEEDQKCPTCGTTKDLEGLIEDLIETIEDLKAVISEVVSEDTLDQQDTTDDSQDCL